MTDTTSRANAIAQARANAAANTPQTRLANIKSLFDLRNKALTQFTGSPQATAQLCSVLLARLSRQPELLQCDPLSLYLAAQKIAALGLSPMPERKHFYLVPYKNKELGGAREAQLQVSYHGMIAMARKHPEVADLWAEVVYQGEPFAFDRFNGTIEHKVGLRSGLTADQLIAAYAVVRLQSGRHVFEVLSRDQVLKRRSCARSPDFWNRWPDEMWKKTAVRALLAGERVPKADGLAAALAGDEEDLGVPAEFSVQVDHEQHPSIVDGELDQGEADVVDEPVDEAPAAEPQEQPAATSKAKSTLLHEVDELALAAGVAWPDVQRYLASIAGGQVFEGLEQCTLVQLRSLAAWLKAKLPKGAPQG